MILLITFRNGATLNVNLSDVFQWSAVEKLSSGDTRSPNHEALALSLSAEYGVPAQYEYIGNNGKVLVQKKYLPMYPILKTKMSPEERQVLRAAKRLVKKKTRSSDWKLIRLMRCA